MVLISSRPTTKVEKEGKPKLFGTSKCNSMSKVFETEIGKWSKRGNEEMRFYVMGIYSRYKEFHPDITAETTLPKLKGKSSFEILKSVDSWIIKTYQVDDTNMAKEVNTTVTHAQIIAMLQTIEALSKQMEWIPTRLIAPKFLLRLGIYKTPKGKELFTKEEDTWDRLFSWRQMHNLLTRLLDALREENIIEYTKSGNTRLIKPFSLENFISSELNHTSFIHKER